VPPALPNAGDEHPATQAMLKNVALIVFSRKATSFVGLRG
jgi:hypothetical protein